jgi:tRNA 2-thiouridine synthesizing protein A
MSRLSRGEREFVSDFGDLSHSQSAELPAAPAEAAPSPARGSVQEIDARGLSAPLPLLRAHRALRALRPGQELRVLTNYAQAVAEFQAMAKHVTTYELVGQEMVGEEVVHVLRRRR